MINYTENFFDLKLLPVSQIKLHEATENNRLRNIYGRIKQDKYLMNPVIVAKYENDYILIDGANRFSSLVELGCRLILAQIIDYKDDSIRLSHWNHFVYDFHINELKDELCKIGIACEEVSFMLNDGRQQKLNEIIATDFQTDKSYLFTLSEDFPVQLSQLFDVTKRYFHKYEFDRTETEITLNELREYSRRKGTLIEFPNFSKDTIVKIAREGLKIPAGLTRHILKIRVLHVKYELENLKEETGIEDKTKKLKEYLLDKIDNNKVRQYTESVIVFDE